MGYEGPLLADRYRLPRPATDRPEHPCTAYDTASGQEVRLWRVLLPEVVDAEVVDHGEAAGRSSRPGRRADGGAGSATRRPADPAVRRAVEAALAASRIPDHPRLDQVYDVFVADDALWIVAELLPARPLAELIARRPLSPHRAAEIADDVLSALRTLHGQGWVHRNVTAATVLVCDDGRAMLTGLAAGAAQEALCGEDPLPDPSRVPDQPRGAIPAAAGSGRGAGPGAAGRAGAAEGPLPAGFRRGDSLSPARRDRVPQAPARLSAGEEQGPAARAARRGAIAAYRAGTQAASARVAAEARDRDGGADARDGDGAEAGRPYGPLGRPYGPDRPAPSPTGRNPVRGAGIEAEGGAALPGPRYGESRPVPAPWPTAAAPREAPARGADTAPGEDGRYRGPTTALAAERARHARMTVVGPVTERWSPEQAGPVHAHWRLAPPVGPAADLWALGVLLFRSVQGYAPYPEDEAPALVQRVCAEAPAPAEECGALRPVVESLLRQDPTERPGPEVLRGWLRSLIRSAPEPDVGRYTLLAPPLPAPRRSADPRRLPTVRRRGELVPGRRSDRSARREPQRRAGRERRPARPDGHRALREAHAEQAPQPRKPSRHRHSSQRAGRSPRSLGRLLLGGILLLLTAAVLYAMWFMPQRNSSDTTERRSSVEAPRPQAPAGSGSPQEESGRGEPRGDDSDDTSPQASRPAAPAEGFRLHEDREGFRLAVPEGWRRSGPDGQGRVRFAQGAFTMTVVPGRDAAREFGADPMAYQNDDEPELEAFRASEWASASGLRRIDVGDTAMAEGTFTWQASGGEVYARNRATLLDGRYHLLLVTGPEDESDAVDRWFEGAADTYRAGR
ncbi:protein kinase [Streptomyces sp. TR06-5]|uniref:protein kinase n=1 Tax=Streptomyces sp. TR06-5 TaxID=3385976 RepID=UPI00399EF09D